MCKLWYLVDNLGIATRVYQVVDKLYSEPNARLYCRKGRNVGYAPHTPDFGYSA